MIDRPVYRAFIIATNGSILRGHVLDCSTDQIALQRAEQLADGCAVELWDRTRRIAVLQSAN
ncbi:hypothetical protein [Antarcticirhabdus aurantiaca]|uniref:Uncharacterized protein n=1 Tax=Antarcticirhabdus aurantiaca TaxID=2606717 RepID=A0ACD4NM99_9HYPH|nr:hypothetical protein [Antarcticirhabdus aurantiaca]WAJ27874.1 hypothetical protein OXU80_24020 [Jeongeuplla avenae]